MSGRGSPIVHGVHFGDFQASGTNVHYNPLFLSSSDHPGMQLVSTPFNGLNFSSWSRGIRLALGAKTKLGFVNGGCKKPEENDPDYDKWIRADYMVMCWILNSMNADVVEGFMFVQTSKELWDEIGDRFSESNDPLIFQLRRDLANMKQENESVGAYFGKIKRIWDELQMVDAIPTCQCGVLSKCSCSVIKKMIEREDKAKVMQFLMGLNEAYELLRNNVISTEPMANLGIVFKMAIRIERMSTSKGSYSDASALAVNRNVQYKQADQGQYRSDSSRKESKKAKLDKTCDFCHEKGHLKEACFKLIGYPDWYKGNKGKAVVQSGNFAGQVEDIPQFEHPLEQGGVQDSQPDPTMVAAIYQEVMKMMKGKSMASGNRDASANHAMVHFAGP